MRRFLSGLGGRLAIACALIAVVCVVVTGVVMYTSARNNILQAEQERRFDEFYAMRVKAEEPMPCLPDECAALTDQDLLAIASDGLRGPALLALDGTADEPGAGFVGLFPESFQNAVKKSDRVSWLRQRHGLSYDFLIGAPVTLTMHPQETGTPVAPPETAAPKSSAAPTDPTRAPDIRAEGERTVAAYLYASYSMDTQQQQINALAASTIWLVAIMALVAALAGVALARWIARPVRQLRNAVDRLDAGHGTLDVDVKGVQELTGLVEAFNAAGHRLEAAMGELTAKEAQSRRFVADVSHELRTPVTAMVAMADVLENASGGEGPVQEAAAVTARSARRLHAMTEDLLEISRFDASRNTVQAECFNVRSQVLVLLESRGMGPGVHVEADGELRFTTDPRRFDVVVGNLLVNAANHGGEPIKVQAFKDGTSLVVKVGDHGRGIPAESMDRLFDRFYKTDSSRSRGGSGLGLSLVQENCRLLGGSVKLSSAGHPTVFTVRLPPQGAAG
ncbi:signal transduction histidine kinase [Arthrobacter stackebrandtii]|uniref:histidine kinase n=1 Tax=Arthrobacter stackebrandtii TaxID=272161 RepID=A0ABS4YUF9_9MICC|nr:HAMP domain-containing sensor histidine kinase [Arthrobacter stackebrandtii]MBP2412432.1 signal transduction histidine kinase [Arthrobacter stackebrandtii]PYH02197.1 hypothetical protein CVV67_01810 [Arthrobacter stackebrandtii]